MYACYIRDRYKEDATIVPLDALLKVMNTVDVTLEKIEFMP